MKKFTDICKLSQNELKTYMADFLSNKGYQPINQDGFLYAAGDVPVLLVAHLDTVHAEKCREIVEANGQISSPQGIGGDDRCGVFIIMNLIKDLHCSVLLCEDEEHGGKGAYKFTSTPYINELGVNYMLEFDRKGKDDAVFYSCDNADFTEFVIKTTGYVKQNGSFSDISVLAPAAKICAVNLSSGYYNPHTLKEYVDYNEMMSTVRVAKNLIETECAEPFVYKRKEFVWPETKHLGQWNQMSMFDDDLDFGMDMSQRIIEDKDIVLTVTIRTVKGKTKALVAEGETKMACWFDLFTSYTDICLDDVIDYSFA